MFKTNITSIIIYLSNSYIDLLIVETEPGEATAVYWTKILVGDRAVYLLNTAKMEIAIFSLETFFQDRLWSCPQEPVVRV